MEAEKLQINLAPGQPAAEITIREGAAPKVLEPKAPVKIAIAGTIGVPLEFIGKRLKAGQFEQKDCHILVDRDKIKITLIINERDEYNRGEVTGSLMFNPKYIEFGVNTGKLWTPTELGMFFKMNRAFFPDMSVNMKLVSNLMNFTASVNSKIEGSVKESGDRTDNFSLVVNSNLPPSFVLQIPIFKGLRAETLEVETFAKIDGRAVSFILISPGAQSTLEEIRDGIIDEQLEMIRELAPDIAIIEI